MCIFEKTYSCASRRFLPCTRIQHTAAQHAQEAFLCAAAACNLAVYLETSRSQLHEAALVPHGAAYCRYRCGSDSHWPLSDCRQGLRRCTLDHTMPSHAPEPLKPFLEDSSATPPSCLYCLCHAGQLSFYLCNCPTRVGCSDPLRRADSSCSPFPTQRPLRWARTYGPQSSFPKPTHRSLVVHLCTS